MLKRRGSVTCRRIVLLLLEFIPGVGSFWFFFFQAEDGIRDLTVTGVQTCALPICPPWPRSMRSRKTCRAGKFRISTPSTAGSSRRDGKPWPSWKPTCSSVGIITRGDRKSTRLNSSHSQISYAVFCLKKKKKKKTQERAYISTQEKTMSRWS